MSKRKELLTDDEIKQAWNDCYGGMHFGNELPLVFARTIRSRQVTKTHQLISGANSDKVAEMYWEKYRYSLHGSFHEMSWNTLKNTATEHNVNGLHLKDCQRFARQFIQLWLD